MPATSLNLAPVAPPPARGRTSGRTPVQVGRSALRASLGARLLLAAALSAVMWVAVALVVHL